MSLIIIQPVPDVGTVADQVQKPFDWFLRLITPDVVAYVHHVSPVLDLVLLVLSRVCWHRHSVLYGTRALP